MIDHMKWLWAVIARQNQKIVSENQIGINSRKYSPSRYFLSEYGTTKFVSWFLAKLQGKQDTRPNFRKEQYPKGKGNQRTA